MEKVTVTITGNYNNNTTTAKAELFLGVAYISKAVARRCAKSIGLATGDALRVKLGAQDRADGHTAPLLVIR